jgi:hypothetical protein
MRWPPYERHDYEMYAYYERHAYEMAPVRSTSMRDASMRDTPMGWSIGDTLISKRCL